MKFFAVIYTAHGGKGTPYVAINEDAATKAPRTGLHWSRRRIDSLPGLPHGEAGSDPNTYMLVADAREVGVLKHAQDFFSTRLGPGAFPADKGKAVWMDVDIEAW